MLSDTSVFDEGWVPQDLHSRDQETTALADQLTGLVDPHRQAPKPLLLHGPPGTGKTSTTEWVLEDIEANTPATAVVIDAWENHQPYQAYRGLLQGLGRPGAVQPQTPQTVLHARVQKALPDDGVVVGLDEADQLDDPGLIQDLDALPDVAVVLIVNDSGRFEARLHREDAAMGFEESIPYDPYSVTTTMEILRPRARRGLEADAWSESILREAASLATGNARVAIQTLREAAQHARGEGHDTITTADIEVGREEARGKIRRKNYSKLTRHERLVLDVVEDCGEAGKAEIYEGYISRVGEGEARGERRVGDYLVKLEAYGQLESDGSGRGTTYRPAAVSVAP